MTVAALYVDPRGPYPKLLGPDMCCERRKGYGGRRPAHILACSAQPRRRTPVAFAEWLIELAATAVRP